MQKFDKLLSRLNTQQLEAVQAIDGPVLVIAGPGTGKTQLLGVRVANILSKTDTLPQNILCLTFTENGAANMRERLTRFIGQAAYGVNISTYHSFGGELIGRFPEYFGQTRLQSPIDDLGKRNIINNIVEQMSYDNSLKSTKYHLGDLSSTISEVKRGLLTSQDLIAIATENQRLIDDSSPLIADIFGDFTKMPSKLEQAAPYFDQTLKVLQNLEPAAPANQHFGSLAKLAATELLRALNSAKKPELTKWKNTWLVKDLNNNFMLAGSLQNARVTALAEVVDQYQAELDAQGLYDFDDMILRSVAALTNNPDFKYTLQEQYLYLLLDEFQDTNAAQLRLVELLTDNPVNERRPNVLAVGDDDQAIYAFQGASYSNMLDFYGLFADVKLVNLTKNYRSSAHILQTAKNVAEQVKQRLHHQFNGMSKILEPANVKVANQNITRHEFSSDATQNDWIAKSVAAQIKSGVNPSQIAILAPQHKYLEALLAPLARHKVPVSYQKRENILAAEIIKQLLQMSRLVMAINRGDEQLAAAYWPEILSYDFWALPVSDIWKLSWKVSDSHGELKWTAALLEDPQFRVVALLFLSLAGKASSQNYETILDHLIGTTPLETYEPTGAITSPIRAYYTSRQVLADTPELFYDSLSHLTVLRTKLREFQATQTDCLTLPNMLDFVDLYLLADQPMLNTSPYAQAKDAVQLMTVFKAKGLEFEHVYLPSCNDDVWGESSRSSSNKISLPANLSPIRHAGATPDERLRILFVAITRAKIGLHLTSHSSNYAGKSTKPLKYLLDDTEVTQNTDDLPPNHEILENTWKSKHSLALGSSDWRAMLQERLAKYQLSPTHLNTFTDMEYGGPEAFLFNTLLRFPSAPTPAGQFGNAIHETLQWLQLQVNKNTKLPSMSATKTYFATAMQAKKLEKAETERLVERGNTALTAYLSKKSSIFVPGNVAEHDFRNEGVFTGDAHLSGKIDLMEIDKKQKTITVVDYKTGKSYSKWASDLKLHKYRAQLYCYKILIEGSHTFKGYTVNSARLEFIEPDTNGQINSLELVFDNAELVRIKQLITAIWQNIKTLNFPNTTSYLPTLTGTKQFENSLING